MKIGLVCPYNLYRPGGVQMQVRAQLDELRSRGHDVVLIAPRPRKHEPSESDDPDIVLFGTSTELNTPLRTKADVSIHAGPHEIKEFLLEKQFDILHFHEPWVPMLPLQILNQSEAINVATFHAKMPGMRIYRALGKAVTPYTKSIVKKLDHLVGVSRIATEYINSIVEYEVDIIPNGINTEQFRREAVQPLERYNDDIKTILYLNRLEKGKGPDLLLKAYKHLCEEHDDLRLVMASDGDMRQELEVYVAAYDLPNVEFVGFVSDEEKLQLYRSADVYCSPAPYGESFGVVILEALAMQTPLVGGDNPGYAEPLGERAREYLVDPTLTHVLARRLEEMLYNETKRQSYQEWSRQQAEKFSFVAMVDAYEALYEQLLAKK